MAQRHRGLHKENEELKSLPGLPKSAASATISAMQSECAVCRSYQDDGLPGANFPAEWQEGQSTGNGRAHLRLCKACGTTWHIGWNPKDSVYEGCSRIPGGLVAALRSLANPEKVIREAVATEGAQPVIRHWIENELGHAGNLVVAIRRALAGHYGVLDGGGIQRCLDWLETFAHRGANAARTLAEDQALLELLCALPDRPRPVADRIAVRASALTIYIDRIGQLIERVAPERAARLRAQHSPGARRARALALLRLRLEDDGYPYELVLQGLTEVAQSEPAKLPFDAPGIDLMLELLERASGTGPGRSPVIARNLLSHFEKWSKADVIPVARRAQVAKALEAKAR
jgi:hypothetical protein